MQERIFVLPLFLFFNFRKRHCVSDTGRMIFSCLSDTCLFCMCAQSAQSCPTLCDPMDCSLPGSSVYGIFQARILKWIAIVFSRGSSQPRDQTHVSCVPCIGRVILYHWAAWEAHYLVLGTVNTLFYIINTIKLWSFAYFTGEGNPGFPESSFGKESACNAGDTGLIPRLGRSTGEGIGYLLQYSWASLVVQPVKNTLFSGQDSGTR